MPFYKGWEKVTNPAGVPPWDTYWVGGTCPACGKHAGATLSPELCFCDCESQEQTINHEQEPVVDWDCSGDWDDDF